jgi:PAS domain S-box-containing protein
MPSGADSWARLVFEPFTGEMKVDGDLFAVLGISADKLIHSSDPVSMLPNSIARVLIEGGEIARDQELHLVIIPGKSETGNTVTIIAEQITDFDLVSDMAGGVVGFAPDGTILRWNMRMTYLFGPREKDVEGRNASDILPTPVLYDWGSVISSAHLGHEVRVEFKPSSEKRVEGVLSRGGPGVIGLFRDSTENYRTSKRLRALNRLNQAYLQSTVTGLLLLDSRLRILLSNSGFSRITGTRGSLIGLQLHDTLPENLYKWVHDASEHLFAEEGVEQSGIISFTNREGRQVTLRQTLRAVRNETNQALNFVCLFEDETDLTYYRDETAYLKQNFLGVSRMFREVLKSGTDSNCGVCEEILRVTRSRAVALFSYDAFETVKLAGSAGNWPEGYPGNEPGKFSFPAVVWGTDKHYRVTSTDLGKLSKYYDSCTILPVGEGVSNQGYLVIADSSLSDSDSDLLDTVSSLVKLQSDLIDEKAARLAAEKHLELNDGFPEKVLDRIPLPLAIVKMDGQVVHWNQAMELVSLVKAGEVDVEDINNLVDPERRGLTLDSRVSGCDRNGRRFSSIHTVKRRDGTESEIYRWNVSIVDESTGFSGDPAFLISGVPWNSEVLPAESNEWHLLQGVTLLEKAAELLVASDQSDTLEAVAGLCLALSGSGIIEFSSSGKRVAAFPPEAESCAQYQLSARSPASINGVDYQIRASVEVTQQTIDTVIELLFCSYRDGMQNGSEKQSTERKKLKYLPELAVYLEQSSSVAIEQNNAILHIMDGDDPLAGFARTMLYSNETASRVTQLLRLSIQVDQMEFTEEFPDRFLGRLHGEFAETGLRPPSLSISEKVPSVFIVTEVLLQCFALLCRLSVIDDIVSFKVSKTEDNNTRGILLTLQGLNVSFGKLTEDEIRQRLTAGSFNSETEAAIVYRILQAAGCSLLSVNGGELVFLLRSSC